MMLIEKMLSRGRLLVVVTVAAMSCLGFSQRYSRETNYYSQFAPEQNQGSYRLRVLGAILAEKGLEQFSKEQLSSVVPPPSGDTGWAPVWTPVIYAVAHGRTQSFKYLAKLGVRLDVEVGKGKTLMHLAASAGSGDLIRLLAVRGFDLNKQDKFGRSPFRYAALGRRYGRYAGVRSAVNALLDLGAETTAMERGFAADCACLRDYDPNCWTDNGYVPNPKVSRDILVTCERLLRMGVTNGENPYQRLPGWEDDLDLDNWAIVHRDILDQALVDGDLNLLKMVAKYTPGWPKSQMSRVNGYNAIDLAAYAENWHIVRWLRTQGFPRPAKIPDQYWP